MVRLTSAPPLPRAAKYHRPWAGALLGNRGTCVSMNNVKSLLEVKVKTAESRSDLLTASPMS